MDFVLNEQTGYRPDDFGRVTTAENAEEHLQEIYSDQLPTADYTARVPILMYHSIVETDAEESEWSVSREHFAQHLQAMTDAGYTIVDYADLIAYVEQGVNLPDHPVVLSFDDGYQDNLALAAPELQAHNARATIAVIGCSVGKSTYKDSDTPITPHFALEDARPWVESGVLNIQSHSYDMHQVPELDGAECRTGVLRMEGESETDYAAKLEADYQRSKVQIESALPVKSEVFTYPYGSCDTLSEVVLHSQGIRVTVIMSNGVSELIKGIPQSLYQLKRINVPGGTTPQMLLNLLP